MRRKRPLLLHFAPHLPRGCVLVVVACALTGCQAILGPDDDARPSDLPWSEPAGWESQTMGVPY